MPLKVEEKEQGKASLQPGDGAALQPISEFGAKPYTEDEHKELSEIVKAFNDHHGCPYRILHPRWHDGEDQVG